MKKQLQRRLQSLQTEYEAGQKVLAELEAKQASVRDTLLRISGAIQVLEEELSQDNSEPNGAGTIASASNLDIIPASETV